MDENQIVVYNAPGRQVATVPAGTPFTRFALRTVGSEVARRGTRAATNYAGQVVQYGADRLQRRIKDYWRDSKPSGSKRKGIPKSKKELKKSNKKYKQMVRKYKKGSKTSKRKRRSRSYSRTKKRKTPRLSSILSRVRRMVDTPLGNPYKEKAVLPGNFTSDANKCNYSFLDIGGKTQINAILNDAFKTASGASIDLSGTTSTKKIYVKNSGSKVHFRNNEDTDLCMWLYWVNVKKATDDDPVTAIKEGINSKFSVAGGGTGNWEKICFWPNHSDIFRKNYVVKRMKAFKLKPGDEFHVKLSMKPYWYDIQAEEDDIREYRKHRTGFLLIRQSGCIGRDATNGNVLLDNSQLDYIHEQHYTMQVRDLDKKIVYQQTDALPNPVGVIEQMQQDDPQNKS